MHKHTYYLAKEPTFADLASIIANLEPTIKTNDTVDIISLFTGEVYANRNVLGLWKISR